MSESTKDEGIIKANVSRRSVLKWSGALAAAGIIGIGLGIGGDLLIRPSTTKTTTSTATGPTTTATSTKTGPTTTVTGPTTTVTVPPPTLSYMPPLSPEIQNKVDEIVSSLISRHQGESITYSPWSDGIDSGIVKIRTQNGIVTAVEPDDTYGSGTIDDETAMETGMYAQRCGPLSYAMRDELYSPDRILYPMQNVGTKGSGQLVRITWDEALNTIAQNISNVVNEYGDGSIWSPSIWGMMSFDFEPYIGGSARGWGSLSHAGGFVAWNHVLGGAGGAPWVGWSWSPGNHSWDPTISSSGNTAADVLNAKLIVLWAGNLCQNMWPNMPYMVRLAKDKGIPIISIEPRYSITAEVLADQWIPIRPSTDIAMMLAVANVMFNDDNYDKAFVSQWVEPTGFQNFKDYVLGNTVGADGQAIARTPEWAAPICGVPADTITAFARLYETLQPVHLRVEWGQGRYIKGENVPRAAMYLQAMAGSMGVAGGSEPNSMISASCAVPAIPTPSVNMQQVASSRVTTVMMAGVRWPDAILQRPFYDSGQISQSDYKGLTGTLGDVMPNIHFLMLWSDLNSQLSDVTKNCQAMAQCDFVLVWGYHLAQPSAHFADMVLPAPLPFGSSIEATPTGFWFAPQSANGFAGLGFVGNGFSYGARAVQPQGEVRDAYWVMVQLANLLGIGQQYSPLFYNVQWGPDWDAKVDAVNQSAYEAWAALPAVTSQFSTIPTWSEFKTKPVVRYPIVTPSYAFYGDLSAGKNPYRNNVSKKIEFYSNYFAEAEASPEGPESYLETNNYVGVALYGPCDIPPMAEWNVSPHTFFGSDTATYPLFLMTSHQVFRYHSAGWYASSLNGNQYQHKLWISIADATARGINDGDLVRVFNDIGEFWVPAYVTSKILPGVVLVFEGAKYTPNSEVTDTMLYGVDAVGSANCCMTAEPLPYSGVGATISGNNVQVESLVTTSSTTTEETTS